MIKRGYAKDYTIEEWAKERGCEEILGWKDVQTLLFGITVLSPPREIYEIESKYHRTGYKEIVQIDIVSKCQEMVAVGHGLTLESEEPKEQIIFTGKTVSIFNKIEEANGYSLRLVNKVRE